GSQVAADQSQWKTFRGGVSLYAGETVKLRLRRYFGTPLFDNAGVGEAPVPGWKLNTVDPVTAGTDGSGTYLAPYNPLGTVYVRSAVFQMGLVDRVNVVDQRYLAMGYAIGDTTGSLIRATWYNSDTGQSWVVTTDSADSPTGYRERYFW